MARMSIENKLDLFIDKSTRYYMQRVYWSDFDIKKEIDAVGYATDLTNINNNIKELDSLKEVRSDAASASSQSADSYNALVRLLNAFKARPDTQDDKSAKALEKEINSYFDIKKLKIYLDEGDSSERSHEGYYLSGNRLSYYSKEKGASFDIGTISEEDANNLFPELYQTGMSDMLGAKSVNLNSYLFRSMIEATKPLSSAKSRPLTFYVPANGGTETKQFYANSDFIEMLSMLRTRSIIKGFSDKHSLGDPRSRLQMVEALIKKIKEKSVLDEAYKESNQDKVKALKSINKFLANGNLDGLSQIVEEYDSGSFASYLGYEDKVDRIVASVRDMLSSDFFPIALQEIQAKKEELEFKAGEAARREAEEERARSEEQRIRLLEQQKIQRQIEAEERMKEAQEAMAEEEQLSKFDYPDHVAAEEMEMAKEKIRENWAIYSVTKEDCVRTMTDLLQILEDNAGGLPEVILPEKMTKSLGGDEVQPGAVSAYLELFVRQALETIQVAPMPSPNFQIYCAYIQEKIVEILNYHYLDNGRTEITEEQILLYNQLGEALFARFKETKMRPDEDPKDMISVDSVREEIIRLQTVYSNFRKVIESLKKDFSEIAQTSVSNSLLNFLNTKYQEYQNLLDEKLTEIQDIQGEPFDLLKPSDQNQAKVKDVFVLLESLRNDIYTQVIEIIKTKATVSKDGIFTAATALRSSGEAEARKYIPTHTGRRGEEANQRAGVRFGEIMASVEEVVKEYSRSTSFLKSNVAFEPSSMASSPSYTYSSSSQVMFAKRRGDEREIDSSLDMSRRIGGSMESK